MSEVDPKSIKEIIAKANDVDLAAALARVSGRWRCTFCESDTPLSYLNLSQPVRLIPRLDGAGNGKGSPAPEQA